MTRETREATWARTGTDVSMAKSVDEVLSLAKLDYEVEKVPVFLPSGAAVNGKFATVQKHTDKVFGVVGNNYTICQNEDAFEFVNYIDEDLRFVRAGETKAGLIYIIAELPEQYVLGDAMKPYVIFQNSHNGTVPVKAAISPLRIICQNQFNMAFKNSDNTVTIRHSLTLEDRMIAARQLLKTTASYMDRFRAEAAELAAINIARREAKIVEAFYPIAKETTKNRAAKIEEKRFELLTAYKDLDDNQNFRGTAWGLVNAYADIITHESPGRKTENWEETKFTKVTFDPNIMGRFINHIRKAA